MSTSRRSLIFPIAWLALSICFVIWQPLRLGFYLDDWPQIAEPLRQGPPFSAALWHYFQALDPSRPGFVLLRYLLSSVLLDDPFVWQAALLASNLLISAALAWFGCELLGLARPRSWAAPLGAAAVWLLMPWNAAANFWPSLVVSNLLMAAFAWAGVLLLRGWRRGATWALLPAALYCAICLSYEAFYFQFIPLILIGLFLARQGVITIGAVVRSSVSLTAAQAVAAIWHVFSNTGLHRPIEPKWPLVFLSNGWHLIPEMVLSAYELRFILLAGIMLLLCFTGAAVIRRRQMFIAEGRRLLMIVIVCLAGAGLSIFAFSLGGRGLIGTGPPSRVLSLFSWWFVLGLVALTAGLRPFWSTKEGRLIAVAAAGIGCVLGAAHVMRAEEWARAWETQKRVLAHAPLAAILQTEQNATVLYVSPTTINGAPVFAADWDLVYALPLTHGPKFARGYLVYNPRMGPRVWDRREIRYAAAQGSGIPASRLYLWRPANGTFQRVASPFRIDRDLSITMLKQ